MFKNILWEFTGKFGSQIVSFCISIVLARLLSPKEYGLMAMVMVIITFAHVFLELGFNRAIIQQPEVSNLQLSTIFYINAAVAVLLTAGCFLLASPLASFYHQPAIRPIFRVASVSFLLNGLNLVPSALMYRRMYFKANNLQLLLSAVISGFAGIFLAYHGYGVWSLVLQSLLGSLLIMIFNYGYSQWFPALQFNFASIRPLWKYGSKMFASGVLDALYSRLDTFIIAKMFSPYTLGYYARAQSTDNMVKQVSASSLMSALFPHIAKHQSDRHYLRELYQKYLHIISFVSIAISGVLFLTSGYLFDILFTSKWNFAAQLFRLMAIMGFAWPVSSLMCNIIAGVGNSNAFFRLEVYKRILILPVYVFGFLLGIKGFLVCMIIASILGVGLNSLFVSRELTISLLQQSKIIYSYFISGAAACAIAWVIYQGIGRWMVPNNMLSCIILGSCFTCAYLLIAFVLKLKGLSIANLVFSKKIIPHDQRYPNLPSA